VPDENPIPLAHQHQPEAPAELPRFEVGHRLEPAHLLDRLSLQYSVCAVDEEDGPAHEVGRCRPERPGCCERALAEVLLLPHTVRVRLDEVAGCRWLQLLERRALEPQRTEEALVDVLLVFEPRAASHDLAKEREGEVRVVPARTCRQYLFCVR